MYKHILILSHATGAELSPELPAKEWGRKRLSEPFGSTNSTSRQSQPGLGTFSAQRSFAPAAGTRTRTQTHTHRQQEQVKTKCVPANSQGRVSKQASICGGGKKTGRRKKQQKSQRSQNDDRVTGLASISSHSSLALRGPSAAFARRGKEKSTRACNVHTWPSKQVSRGRKERGPCHKMPRSFTVKSTTSRRWRRREKTEEEKYNRGGLSQGRVKTKVHSGYMAVGSSSPQQRS